jgi:hypothetical protein
MYVFVSKLEMTLDFLDFFYLVQVLHGAGLARPGPRDAAVGGGGQVRSHQGDAAVVAAGCLYFRRYRYYGTAHLKFAKLFNSLTQ